MRSLATLLACLLSIALPVGAQEPAAVDAPPSPRTAPHSRALVVPSVMGSLAGLVVGVGVGLGAVYGTGSEGDALSANMPWILGGAAGSAFGSAIGASLSGASLPHALGGAVAGLLPAVFVGAAGAAATDSPAVLVLGFTVTQGTITALIAGAPPRQRSTP